MTNDIPRSLAILAFIFTASSASMCGSGPWYTGLDPGVNVQFQALAHFYEPTVT